MKNEIVTACYQLVTAGINGTIQGIMVALLVAGGLRLMGRTNAATRHAVWFATLLLLALIIPANLLREYLESAHGSTVVQEAESSVPDSISKRGQRRSGIAWIRVRLQQGQPEVRLPI